MAYDFYLDKILLPVTPEKLTIKISNTNKTYTLIDEGEVNVLKTPGLSQVEFDILLPNAKYPFAVYPDGFKEAAYYLEEIEKLKVNKQPFQFIVSRLLSNKTLSGTNMTVALEDYTIKEDAKSYGLDVMVSIKLKQYRPFKTKTYSINSDTGTLTTTEHRSTINSPMPTSSQSYTVVSGDSLWKIAKKFYDDGSKYKIIYNANSDKISNPNLIYPGQSLIIPAL